MVPAGRLPLMIRRGPPILLVQKTKGFAHDLPGAAIVTGLDLRGNQRDQFGREIEYCQSIDFSGAPEIRVKERVLSQQQPLR